MEYCTIIEKNIFTLQSVEIDFTVHLHRCSISIIHPFIFTERQKLEKMYYNNNPGDTNYYGLKYM